jgi:hypothetical protein
MPSPLAGASLDVATNFLELLILARFQTDDNIRLAGTQGEDVDAGSGAERANSCAKWRSSVPMGLEGLS